MKKKTQHEKHCKRLKCVHALCSVCITGCITGVITGTGTVLGDSVSKAFVHSTAVEWLRRSEVVFYFHCRTRSFIILEHRSEFSNLDI